MKNKTDIAKLAMDNRKRIIDMIYYAKAGHPGGSLSIIDLLTAVYELDVDFSTNPRTRVVFSKGHAVPAQYAVLHQKGFISDDEMHTFRTINSRLQGHPHILDIPETDATTGLLGQGLSLAVGMAIAKKRNNAPHHVWAIVGDGEIQEGQIWEALMEAPHYNLDNLILVVDYNKLSSSGSVNQVINLEPLDKKLEAFNWDVHVIDGHNFDDILKIIELAKKGTGKPIAVIANTVKGKCVSFMENNPKWHSSPLTDEEYKIAIENIESAKEAI